MFFPALAAILLFTMPASAQPELKRKAQHGFRLSKITAAPGATVSSVVEGSPAANSGLAAGDRVLAINGAVFSDVNSMLSRLRTLRGGVPVTLRVLKKISATPQSITFTPASAPLETYTSLSLEPIVLNKDLGMPLRGFVTRPKQATGKLPAILFVSWLSCGTVEAADTSDSWVKMLRDVAERSGCLLLRVEKPGVGDSEGTPCADTDLDTELNGYEAALRYLKSRNDVDTNRIILFGGSIGGTLTARVGRGHAIKAYISAVSVYKTWFEHMIELERRRLQLSGTTASDATEAMRGYTALYTEYLLYHKTPSEVIREKPHLEKWWYDEPEHQYGRPAVYYHQL